MGERSGAIPSDHLLVTDGVHASAAGQVQILRTVIAGLADGATASAQPPEISDPTLCPPINARSDTVTTLTVCQAFPPRASLSLWRRRCAVWLCFHR
jgi:hypothetical protein